MSERDSDERLRVRVRDAVADLPGPDRARLVAVERALPFRRRRRWFWPLVIVLTGSAAAIAAWHALAPSPRDTAQPPKQQEQARPTRGTTTESDPAREHQPSDRRAGHSDQPGDRGSATVIYRD